MSFRAIANPATVRRRLRIRAQTDDHCWYCGVRFDPPDDFHIDHVQARARGGRHHRPNLVAACRSCNLTKGARSLEEFRAELERRRSGVPRFSAEQLAYLSEVGITLPTLPTYVFWFEEQGL